MLWPDLKLEHGVRSGSYLNGAGPDPCLDLVVMKVEMGPPEYRPVVITLETKEEFDRLAGALMESEYSKTRLIPSTYTQALSDSFAMKLYYRMKKVIS